MPIEIERKFLVRERRIALPERSEPIDQGYLTATSPVVRVRRMGDRGYLNIKSKQLPPGTVLEGIAAEVARAEYEYEIPLRDALELLALCPWKLVKRRHYFEGGFEYDVFAGALDGLELLEYESHTPEDMPATPDGLVLEEVTGDPRFSNIRMALGELPANLAELRVRLG
ncbi:MAG: CYTH domain-containing protein [Candidatus Sumerlaeia bacterium]|nr:CYTH domain-containing protein [Candidatus Sumerlaeia bacterium]